MALRIVFMGTPVFSVAALDALYAAGHDIAAVYTQPPRPAGRRGLELTPSPVHARAGQLGLEVRTPKTLRDADAQAEFRALDADCAVVVAYGLILPLPILEGTRHGAFNIHASLLPRWRGAAPIHRAIEAGDTETGVMIMAMDEGLDTGPVALEARTLIGPDETTGMVHDRLAALGGRLIVDAMMRLEAGDLYLAPQAEDGMCYAHKIGNDERRIDWNRAARDVHNHARAMTPFPGAWCEMVFNGKPERVKVLETRRLDEAPSGAPGSFSTESGLSVDCAEGRLEIVRLQRPGGKPMAAEELLRGTRPEAIC